MLFTVIDKLFHILRPTVGQIPLRRGNAKSHTRVVGTSVAKHGARSIHVHKHLSQHAVGRKIIEIRAVGDNDGHIDKTLYPRHSLGQVVVMATRGKGKASALSAKRADGVDVALDHVTLGVQKGTVQVRGDDHTRIASHAPISFR